MSEIIGFPFNGYNKGGPTQTQPEYTSPHINNMRPLDSLGDRYRGGQRPGLTKWSTTQVGEGVSPIVELVTVAVLDV